MKIAVISDSHNNCANIRACVDTANEQGCAWLFHLGDFTGDYAAQRLEGFKGTVRAVFGNSDSYYYDIERVFRNMGGEIRHPPFHFQLEGKRFVLMHEPDYLETMIRSQREDYIFYGHLHKVDVRTIGKAHILNPGQARGSGSPSAGFFIVDLASNHFEHIRL